MGYPVSSAATGRRRRTGGGDPLYAGAKATRGSKGYRTAVAASVDPHRVDEQLLGCTVPRLGRTRGTGARASGACTWQASRVLQLALLEDEDEREALEALCFLSASSCQLEHQAVQAQLACQPGSPEQQQGQNSKGSSYTAEEEAAPMELSYGWLAAAGVRHPSPGSDVSSDGCQGALIRPEQQQQPAAVMEEIHPGAHPVEIEHLTPGGTHHLLLPGSQGSRKQQQLHVREAPQQQQQQQQQQDVAALVTEPHANLLDGALLAMQQASSAGQQHAVHAPAAAAGLQQLLPAQLASLLQAGNYDAAAAAAGLSSATPLAPLHLQQQAHQQPGLSELLGLMSVGLPHAGLQQPPPSLLPITVRAQQPSPVTQHMPVAGKRPPVKGCYWHVYIAKMIAAGRRQQEAQVMQQSEPQQQAGHMVLVSTTEQPQPQQPGLAVQRKSSSPRLMEAAGGGSPCKRQKRQQPPVMQSHPQQQLEQAVLPQMQLLPAAPLPTWLPAAGVLPPALALAAAAAAATAAGHANVLPQLLQPAALSGSLAAAASSLAFLGAQGPPTLPLLGMPAAAALGPAAVGPAPELLMQLLMQQQQQHSMAAAAVCPAAGMPAAFLLHGLGAGLLQGGGFPAAGALLRALAASGMGLVAQQ